MIQDGIIGELSLTKPFIGCYLGSEFSELNRPSLDNESRNLLILTKMTENSQTHIFVHMIPTESLFLLMDKNDKNDT